MENDITALARRVQRLEALLGASDRNPHLLDAQLDAAYTTLRCQVPDEAVAASRALTLLSAVTGPRLASMNERLRMFDNTLTDAQQGLGILKDHTQENREAQIPPIFSKTDSDTLDHLIKRQNGLTKHIDKEEYAVDRLLLDFDAATASLNSALLALADQARAAVLPSPSVVSEAMSMSQPSSAPMHSEEHTESHADPAPAASTSATASAPASAPGSAPASTSAPVSVEKSDAAPAD